MGYTKEQLISLDDAAAFLNVAPLTVIMWIETKKLPHVLVRQSLRFRKRDLKAWAFKNGIQFAPLDSEGAAPSRRPVIEP
jgi:excisionase family DNA binding protein